MTHFFSLCLYIIRLYMYIDVPSGHLFPVFKKSYCSVGYVYFFFAMPATFISLWNILFTRKDNKYLIENQK